MTWSPRPPAPTRSGASADRRGPHFGGNDCTALTVCMEPFSRGPLTLDCDADHSVLPEEWNRFHRGPTLRSVQRCASPPSDGERHSAPPWPSSPP
ncbi:hypothetical protein NOCA1170177 [metagenome]|uniref:Uncharacterized protein n=1 Tax=metagenome TaxID=256318 RepID=A0A2P2CBE3_9ZZZZ